MSIQICNRALSLLKHKMITSLEEDSTEANLCKFLYPLVKLEVLYANLWKCAVKSVTLKYLYSTNEVAKLSYPYKFILPDDVIRILQVNDSASNFIKDNHYLYANSESIAMIYLANVVETEMSPILKSLITLKLAVELSFSLNSDLTLTNALSIKYGEEYKNASNLDIREGGEIFSNNTFEPTWITSRYT